MYQCGANLVVHLSVQSSFIYPVFLNTRCSLQSIKCHVSGHLSSALPTAAASFGHFFPTEHDSQDRCSWLVCQRWRTGTAGWWRVLSLRAPRKVPDPSRWRKHGKAVSEGTCLTVDGDFSYSVNSNCSFTQDHKCFYMFLICAPVVLVPVHPSLCWCSCPGGFVCTDIFLGLHPKAFTPITFRFHPSLTAPLALGFGGAHCHGMFTGLEGVSAASVFSTPWLNNDNQMHFL